MEKKVVGRENHVNYNGNGFSTIQNHLPRKPRLEIFYFFISIYLSIYLSIYIYIYHIYIYIMYMVIAAVWLQTGLGFSSLIQLVCLEFLVLSHRHSCNAHVDLTQQNSSSREHIHLYSYAPLCSSTQKKRPPSNQNTHSIWTSPHESPSSVLDCPCCSHQNSRKARPWGESCAIRRKA